jgi:hypothetical protein
LRKRIVVPVIQKQRPDGMRVGVGQITHRLILVTESTLEQRHFLALFRDKFCRKTVAEQPLAKPGKHKNRLNLPKIQKKKGLGLSRKAKLLQRHWHGECSSS